MFPIALYRYFRNQNRPSITKSVLLSYTGLPWSTACQYCLNLYTDIFRSGRACSHIIRIQNHISYSVTSMCTWKNVCISFVLVKGIVFVCCVYCVCSVACVLFVCVMCEYYVLCVICMCYVCMCAHVWCYVSVLYVVCVWYVCSLFYMCLCVCVCACMCVCMCACMHALAECLRVNESVIEL